MTRLVVGAIIVDSLAEPTRFLAARRAKPADLKGLWEFPGGKVEPGETPQQALGRELQEELGIRVEVGDELGDSWPIDDRLELRLYLAEVTDGEPTPGDDHDELRWLTKEQLDDVDWLPTDAAALPLLKDS